MFEIKYFSVKQQTSNYINTISVKLNIQIHKINKMFNNQSLCLILTIEFYGIKSLPLYSVHKLNSDFIDLIYLRIILNYYKIFMFQQNSLREHLNDKISTQESEQGYLRLQILKNITLVNDQLIEEGQLKILLIKIAFIINQGGNLNEQEKEQLFFGVTRLLLCNNPFIRRLIFKILYLLNVQKYTYVILQSLLHDLNSDNQYLRYNALQSIPMFDDEIYVQYIEKYVKNGILDQNQYISSYAMIIGLKLLKKFPKTITNYYSEIIIEQLTQSQSDNKQHALNLLYELKKYDNSFIKVLLILKQYEFTPLVKIQLMKYMKETLTQIDQNQQNYSNLFKQYLLLQMYYQDSIIFLEAARLVIDIQSISNQQLMPMMKYIMSYLNSMNSHLEIYSALKLIKQLIAIPERQKLFQDQELKIIENQTFSYHTSVSSSAIYICIQFQLLNSNKDFAEYLKQIYQNKQKSKLQQLNFLFGMLELVHLYQLKGNQIIYFLQLVIPQNCPFEVAKIAFEISEYIYISQMYMQLCAMQNLFWISQALDNMYKIKVVKLVHIYWLEKQWPPKNQLEIISYYNLIQNTIFPRFNEGFQKLTIQYDKIDDTDLNQK
ncbi:hypothetical protein pb186bvf_020715 [Paramecium bursaria]